VANNKSAKKRIQIAERNRLINKSYKSTVRTLTKKTLENCEKYKKKNPNEDNKNLVKTSLNKAFSLIDKAVKKNVLHKNNGANKKSKINNFVKTSLTNR
jgi:small subunit ribosomal protein S20